MKNWCYLFGGSGGQESTNDAMLEILKNELDFKLVHITGKTTL